MRRVNGALLGAVLVAGLCWQAPADATTLFSIDISRTSADRDALTFSGSGLIRFDSPASSVADIEFFSLEIETISGSFVNSDHLAVTRRFVFGLPDIISVMNLVAGPELSGLIELAPGKLSEDGGVMLGGSGFNTVLNFDDRAASGFCFGAESGQECIFGGGSSSRIDAELSSAIVPLPWALPLFLAALGGLGLVARPGAMRQGAGTT